MKLKICNSKLKAAKEWKISTLQINTFEQEVISPLLESCWKKSGSDSKTAKQTLEFCYPKIANATKEDTTTLSHLLLIGEKFSDFKKTNDDPIHIFTGNSIVIHCHNDPGQRYVFSFGPQKDHCWIKDLENFDPDFPIYVSVYSFHEKTTFTPRFREFFKKLLTFEKKHEFIFNQAIIFFLSDETTTDANKLITEYIETRFQDLNIPCKHLLTANNFAESYNPKDAPALADCIAYLVGKKLPEANNAQEIEKGIRALYSTEGYYDLHNTWMKEFFFGPPTKLQLLSIHKTTTEKDGKKTTELNVMAQPHRFTARHTLKQLSGSQEKNYININKQLEPPPIKFTKQETCNSFQEAIRIFKQKKETCKKNSPNGKISFDTKLMDLIQSISGYASINQEADHCFYEGFLPVLDYVVQNPTTLVLAGLPKKPSTTITTNNKISLAPIPNPITNSLAISATTASEQKTIETNTASIIPKETNSSSSVINLQPTTKEKKLNNIFVPTIRRPPPPAIIKADLPPPLILKTEKEPEKNYYNGFQEDHTATLKNPSANKGNSSLKEIKKNKADLFEAQRAAKKEAEAKAIQEEKERKEKLKAEKSQKAKGQQVAAKKPAAKPATAKLPANIASAKKPNQAQNNKKPNIYKTDNNNANTNAKTEIIVTPVATENQPENKYVPNQEKSIPTTEKILIPEAVTTESKEATETVTLPQPVKTIEDQLMTTIETQLVEVFVNNKVESNNTADSVKNNADTSINSPTKPMTETLVIPASFFYHPKSTTEINILNYLINNENPIFLGNNECDMIATMSDTEWNKMQECAKNVITSLANKK